MKIEKWIKGMKAVAIVGLLIMAIIAATASSAEARIPPSGSYYDREAII